MSVSLRLKKYLAFFRIRFVNGLQYRTAAYAGIATQFAWGVMRILLFYAFYKADPAAFPMQFKSVASYIWMEQAFLALFNTWSFENDIFTSIHNGNIAYELTRPVDVYNMWFTRSLAVRSSRAVLRCFPILIIAAFIPAPFGLTLPVSIWHFIMFIVTAVLGTCIVVAINMFIYISAFYVINVQGVRSIALAICDVLAGSLIPIPFMPDTFRFIVLYFTPFGCIMDLPLRIYSGDVIVSAILPRFGLQILWLVILVCIGRRLMSRALTKVVVQGG